MNVNGQVSFFKYNKQQFALLEVYDSNSIFQKTGGGYRYKGNDYIGIVVDGNLPIYKKNILKHKLIKGKKLKQIGGIYS
ncbi:hypothetical protein GC105_09255 [Alkalibaculum sp. M08DMB]|uniref:Uncharacterized protein n=1 Tax=Alkalibaculum sporogenes TaxID=2655001 RepID=A0A6A7K9W5_9FIRM|nr:hypothetical protein [Alkalibaculum sporogenes]MPW25977.1 hypothetical protein [Alkalibaculum sporogenes]